MFNRRLRNVRLKTIATLICLVLCVYLVFFRTKNNKMDNKTVFKFEYVVVHLDLKGAPPKLSYLASLLPMLKSRGVNGLLIEYEDMFPYEGRLKQLASQYCYDKRELQKFLTLAVSSGFQIIPLVQTFGHLEFVLKTNKYAHLREDPNFFDTICPSSSESQMLIRQMLKQIIVFHQRITQLKYIHVGCDEVYHLNKCKVCRERNFTKVESLKSHINFLLNSVHNLNPDITILIWDDMYRDVKPLNLVGATYSKTEVVYWDYTPNIDELSFMNMYKYNQMFDNIWVASAFKGADGPTRILPDLRKRFANHLNWLSFTFNYGVRFYRIKGIILTGWSRYKHGDPLCELLPASIPSLMLNLILIEKYANSIIDEDSLNEQELFEQHIIRNLATNLQCQDKHYLISNFVAKSCKYKEAHLYNLLQSLVNHTTLINAIIEDNFNDYFIRSDIEAHINEKYKIEKIQTCSQIYNELLSIEDQMTDVLPSYFDNFVMAEFLQYKIHNISSTLLNLLKLWNNKTTKSYK